MTEGDIQKAVFANLRERAVPGAVFWHVPNDPSSRRKAGYRAGVHDVSILKRKEFFSLELKTENGKASGEQKEFLEDVTAAGGRAYIAHGLDDALAWLEAQGILRHDGTRRLCR